MATAELGIERITNPIDLMERTASDHDWACDRGSDDELTMVVAGTWTDYHVSINWREDLESLHMACAFDFKVPDARLNEIYRLIAQRKLESIMHGRARRLTMESILRYCKPQH